MILDTNRLTRVDCIVLLFTASGRSGGRGGRGGREGREGGEGGREGGREGEGECVCGVHSHL